MPIFHEGEPVSKKPIVDYEIPAISSDLFAQQYENATDEEKRAMLDKMSISAGDISQFASSRDYRAYRGVAQGLYQTDKAYRDKVNELITAHSD